MREESRNECTETTPAPRYMTTREAAQLARVAAKTIRAWVQAGRLKGHWAGRRLLRIRMDELLAFLAAGSGTQDERQETAKEIADRVLRFRKGRC